MKKIYLLITCLFFYSLLSVNLKAQCLTANNGQWPTATFTPSCNGTAETIVNDGYAGEYSKVNVTNGISYTFTSSTVTDFITIGNEAGTVSYAFGTGSVTWTSTLTGVIRFYTHTNNACGDAAVNRIRAIQCTNPTCSGTPTPGTATAAPAILCSAGTSTLTLGGQSNGVSLQWQSSPAGAGTWTNVSTGSGATTTTYTTGTISSNTDFRCRVTCTNGGAIANSTTATVSLGSVPSNDGFCNATTLVLDAAAICGNTTCATSTGDPAFSSSTPNNTVWYKYTPAVTGIVNIVMSRPAGVTSGLLAGWLGVYTATGVCPTLTFTEVTPGLAAYDLPNNPSVTLVTNSLTAGTTYYFMVDGVSAAFGAFCIRLITAPPPPPPPANNECAGAISISAYTGSANGTTVGGTASAGIPGTCAGNADDDVWYSFVARQNGTAAITVVGATGFDAVVGCYSGSCGSLTLVGTCEDATGPGATEVLTLTGLIALQTYYVRVYDYSANVFGTFTITASGAALPVSLTSFTGERQGTINNLNWSTSTEVNNSGFELMRSADGTNFSSLDFIASKASNGNSNATLNYAFADKKPFTGNAYYRLKQIDKDGKTTLSQIVLIKGLKLNKLELTSVYPNPTINTLNVVVSSPKADKVTFVVSDVTGKVILNQVMQIVVGDNNLPISVSHIAKGTYTIKAICADGCETSISKFVKQ